MFSIKKNFRFENLENTEESCNNGEIFEIKDEII